MDFLKLVRARYSVRQYQNRPVEPEKVEQLLEAAQAAPTAANCQPVRLLVVETPDGRRRLAGAAELYGAPLAVVVCADRSRAWKRPFDGKQTTDIDASILTDHMMLAASALGLGSVWICYFQPEAVKAALGLPEHLEPVNILAVGYADGAPASPERWRTERIPLDELVLARAEADTPGMVLPSRGCFGFSAVQEKRRTGRGCGRYAPRPSSRPEAPAPGAAGCGGSPRSSG